MSPGRANNAASHWIARLPCRSPIGGEERARFFPASPRSCQPRGSRDGGSPSGRRGGAGPRRHQLPAEGRGRQPPGRGRRHSAFRSPRAAAALQRAPLPGLCARLVGSGTWDPGPGCRRPSSPARRPSPLPGPACHLPSVTPQLLPQASPSSPPFPGWGGGGGRTEDGEGWEEEGAKQEPFPALSPPAPV